MQAMKARKAGGWGRGTQRRFLVQTGLDRITSPPAIAKCVPIAHRQSGGESRVFPWTGGIELQITPSILEGGGLMPCGVRDVRDDWMLTPRRVDVPIALSPHHPGRTGVPGGDPRPAAPEV